MTDREEFQAAFDKLGYQWSESNQEKAFLGWTLRGGPQLTPEELDTLRKMVWSAIRSRTAEINVRLQAGWKIEDKAGERLDFLSVLVTKLTPEVPNGG